MILPRNIDCKTLVKALEKAGFIQTRQKGSHIRMTRLSEEGSIHVTIPNHSPIKIGTLNSIIKGLAEDLNIPKEEFIKNLFNK
ncbi:MAG: type II toxin-antitoxin system HicA family toxin [Ignavibacteria bacterium]|nr:type II toxin-antitoxin system HicA family toxin [Ignavibacteria bacterium]